MKKFESITDVSLGSLPALINELSHRVLQLEMKESGSSSDTPSASLRKSVGPDEAAAILGLSKSRVYVLCGEGRLPFHKVGNRLHFFTDELDRYIRSGGRDNSKLNNKKAEAL